MGLASARRYLIRHRPHYFVRGFVRSSLQRRVVVASVVITLMAALGLSMVSMFSIRSGVVSQTYSQSRSEFIGQVKNAQISLDSSSVTNSVEYQRVIANLATTLHNNGSKNLVGIYLVGKNNSGLISPVSTAPNYVALVTSTMRDRVSQASTGKVYRQAIGIEREDRSQTPGAVFGSLLQVPVDGGLEMFAIYSYQDQQESLRTIQSTLEITCAVVSIIIGLLTWAVLRSIIRPIETVAAASQELANGDADSVHVIHDRNDEIGVLQHSFNTMSDSLSEKISALEEAEAAQRRFVSDVSHELRTPVTTIRMASDLLESRKGSFDHSTARTTELLSSQTKHFQHLLFDLLEISHYDAGSVVPDLSEIDVRDPVREALSDVAHIAQQKNAHLEAVLPDTPLLAEVDERRIARLLRNLLFNAIDFVDEGKIQLRLAATPDVVTLSVRDEGAGISPEHLRHIFDRFWRGDPSRSRLTGGTGLGLSIVKEDVAIHHGVINVRSCKGTGTWFLVTLPRRSAQDAAELERPVRFVDDISMRVVGDFLTGTQVKI